MGLRLLGENQFFGWFNQTETELSDMLKNADLDGNGTICLTEFLTSMSKALSVYQGLYDEAVSKSFQAFDKDSNGFISAQEHNKGMRDSGQKLTDQEVDESFNYLISEADADGDGQINYEEFMKFYDMSSDRVPSK